MPRITRRKFIGDVAKASLAASVVPRHVLGGPRYRWPSDTLNLGIIGAGGMGASNAEQLLAENIIAVCDIDYEHVASTLERKRNEDDPERAELGRRVTEAYDAATRYTDFRVMLERESALDGVVIATPDHLHAVIAQRAMEAGLSVYVQKPLTYSVYEARVLRDTARRTGVVTQMGNQGHSSRDAELVNEWVRGGVIGPVREVHAWTNRPIWPQGLPRPTAPEPPEIGDGNGDEPRGPDWRRFGSTLAAEMHGDYAVPDHLAWDLFLGPAPQRDYHPIYHPFNWRGWVDWGVGALGDMGAHLIDHPYWALELGYPETVEATSSPWGGRGEDPATYPAATLVHYTFPARGAMPAVDLTWYDGGLMPARPELLPEDVQLDRTGGVLYVGERGLLMHETYGANPTLYPASLMEEHGPPELSDEEEEALEDERPSHEERWADAIRDGTEANSPFGYAAPLTETMLLGLVALRAGQGTTIRYDPENMFITNVPEANQYLHREYRDGWSL